MIGGIELPRWIAACLGWFSILLLLVACSSNSIDGGGGENLSEGQKNDLGEFNEIDLANDRLYLVLLEKIIERNGREEVEERVSEESFERLIDEGFIYVGGEGKYKAQLDPRKWPDPDEYGERIPVYLEEFLWEFQVDWCELENEPTTLTFATKWGQENWGAYETHEEYLASVEDYVNCGTGEIDPEDL